MSEGPTAGSSFPVEGGCTCRAVRYRMEAAPIIVHACHCRWCQRESGSAFAHNAMVERVRVPLLLGEAETVPVPSESGRRQKIVRCTQCRVALWSHYPGGGDEIAFVRMGTLDEPDVAPSDIHIHVASNNRGFRCRRTHAPSTRSTTRGWNAGGIAAALPRGQAIRLSRRVMPSQRDAGARTG
jgi:hypothetical protein